MRRSLAVFAVLAIVLASAGRAGEFKLEYRTGNPAERGISPGAVEAISRLGPPEGASIPSDSGVAPIFATWETPLARDGRVYLAATRDKENGPYESLFVDTDCDGSLSDESPVKSTGPDWREAFPPVEVAFPGHEPALKYSIAVQVRRADYSGWPAREVTTLVVTPACWYEGDVALDGATYRIALVDGNVNGVFDDVSMNTRDADFVGVGDSQKTVQRRLGKYIQIGGKIYHPRPARLGGAIEFLPPEPFATGTVRLTGAASMLTLAGENGELSFDLVDGKTSVPVGKWIPKSWTLARKDADGATWSLAATDFPDRTIFEVAAGCESVLDTGEPVNARIGPAGYSQGAEGQPMKPVYFFAIGGRIGEVVSATRNNGRTPAPMLHIRNADGSYDESVAFEYG